MIDMTFSVAGDKEGFTSEASQLDVHSGNLYMNVTGENPSLYSPVFKQDLSLRNKLTINMKNETDANKFKNFLDNRRRAQLGC